MKKMFKLSSTPKVLTIVVNKLKKNKKKIVIGLSVFLVVFISVFSFINLRYPTKINAYIAHVINKGEPANSYFDDEVFYKAVIDAYNKENKTSLPYTTNLTDKQLSSIKSVSYSGYKKSDSEKIKSTAGIEKLTALTYLGLSWNYNISNIDLSQNTSLINLNLSVNNVSSIDLSKNIKLTNLDLINNNLSSIDLSNNAALTSLELRSNKISSIDLSKSIKLTNLNLGDNKISSIDLSKNIDLTSLYLDYNKISSIDLSKNIKLTNLSLRNNNLSSIDLSKSIKLTYLNLSDNKISSIDLRKNMALTSLYLDENNISNIDLSKNTSLTELNLGYNNISNIDLSKETSLKSLKLYGNNLSNIDLSKNTTLTSLNLSDNNLSSIKLYDNFDISETGKTIGKQNTYQASIDLGSSRIINLTKGYKYYYSSKIVIPSEADIQTFIDNLGLQNLTAKVFNNDEEISSGKIKEDYILKLYYEDIEIDNVPIKMFENSAFNDEVFYKAVIDAYNKENNTSLPYTTNLTDEQLSSIKVFSYNGNGKSNSKKIKSTKGIEKLTSLTTLLLECNNISNIDLSKNIELTNLDLDNNKLSSIDLSNNIKLEKLSTSSNKFEFIDISKNINLHKYSNSNLCNIYTDGSCDYKKLNDIKLPGNTLITLDLGYNDLSSINLSNNTSLTELDLDNNKLSSIDLSKNIKLTNLDLGSNNLSSIDLNNNTSLTKLHLYNNNISNIDLSKNTSLTSLCLDRNNISNIDLSKNTSLTSLRLSDNNISSIDLSNNTSLTNLYFGNNYLSSIDLSKNTFLTYLYLENNELSNIDLSKNTKLTTLHLYNNPLKLNAYVKENGTLTSSSIKMPEGSDKFYLTYEIEDNSIANFADNRLNGLKVGKTSATVTLNGVKASSSSTENMKVDGTITVFDRLKGDISNDDKITIADVSLLYRHVRGTKVIEDSKTLEISDLTGDGKITIADVAKLYRYVRGKINEL